MNERAVDGEALAWCELALIGLSASLVIGFARLFEDGSFVPKLAVMAAAAHLVALAVRRAGHGILASTALSAAALVLTATWLFHPGTTRYGLPTWATRDAVRSDLAEAWELYVDVSAPAPVHPGFVLSAGVALWVVAHLGDWAAFRLWSPVEAVAPAAVVFVFASLQEAEQHRLISTATFAAAALIFALVHRTLREETGANWLATRPEAGRRTVLRMGSAMAGVALLAGVAVGPSLPGAGSEAIVPWRDLADGNGEDDSRVTVSPLVTTKSRLVDLSDVEAFQVRADQPDYWRLTALDEFDGDTWTSSGEYRRARRTLPSSLAPGTEVDLLRQEVTVTGLAELWLPAAFEPRAVLADDGIQPAYDERSGTLTVGAHLDSASGRTYVVESRVPRHDAAALNEGGGEIPREIAEHHLELPDDLSAGVVELAHDVTEGIEHPYRQALALQDWFRGNFAYDLGADQGHSDDALTNFLFETRAGYCEQFSSAYATMARAIGLPARVAVGFTPGEYDEEEGVYRVRGEHAHAWPEVYLAGTGWIRFEPTPGRGAPGDQSYTGIEPQQVSGGAGDINPEEGPTTTAPGENPAETPPDVVPPELLNDPGTTDTAAGPGGGGPGGGPLGAIAKVAAGAAVAGLMVVGAVPLAKDARRRRFRSRLAVSPRGRIDAAWADVMEALELLHVPHDPADTPTEVVRRVGERAGTELGAQLARLAEITTRARFAPDEPDESTIRAATTTARRVRRQIRHYVGRRVRVRRALDPRPLFASP